MNLPNLDWSQVSIGAVGGGVLTWLGAFVTKLFEHYLEGKKQEAVSLRGDSRGRTRRAGKRERSSTSEGRSVKKGQITSFCC